MKHYTTEDLAAALGVAARPGITAILSSWGDGRYVVRKNFVRTLIFIEDTQRPRSRTIGVTSALTEGYEPFLGVTIPAHVREAVLRSCRVLCEPHSAPFRAHPGTVTFECGRGCLEERPEWVSRDGWAVQR